jgi:hypothetical protein
MEKNISYKQTPSEPNNHLVLNLFTLKSPHKKHVIKIITFYFWQYPLHLIPFFVWGSVPKPGPQFIFLGENNVVNSFKRPFYVYVGVIPDKASLVFGVIKIGTLVAKLGFI